MMILAMDTCLDACSVALGKPDGTMISRYEPMHRGHAERLAPMINEVMEEAAIQYQDITDFAITSGPGTFTGVRIGIALLRGMNISLKRPVFVTTSLHLQAYACMPGAALFSPLIVVHDARREQFYVQPFLSAREVSGIEQPQEPEVIFVDELSAYISRLNRKYQLEETQFSIIGSGSELAGTVLDKARVKARVQAQYPSFELLPSAAALVEICRVSSHRQTSVSPLYLRPADAKPQTGKTIKRQG